MFICPRDRRHDHYSLQAPSFSPLLPFFLTQTPLEHTLFSPSPVRPSHGSLFRPEKHRVPPSSLANSKEARAGQAYHGDGLCRVVHLPCTRHTRTRAVGAPRIRDTSVNIRVQTVTEQRQCSDSSVKGQQLVMPEQRVPVVPMNVNVDRSSPVTINFILVIPCSSSRRSITIFSRRATPRRAAPCFHSIRSARLPINRYYPVAGDTRFKYQLAVRGDKSRLFFHVLWKVRYRPEKYAERLRRWKSTRTQASTQPRLRVLDRRRLRSRLPRSVLSRHGCPGEPWANEAPRKSAKILDSIPLSSGSRTPVTMRDASASKPPTSFYPF